MQTLNQNELFYRIALQFTPKIGHKIARKLVQHFGTAQAVFEQANLRTLCQFAGITPLVAQHLLSPAPLRRAEEEWKFIEQYGIEVLSSNSANYPKRLLHCSDAPFLLYYKGSSPLNLPRVIAMVGTRKPSQHGRLYCEQLIQDLLPYQPLLISGLAYGIDITCHRQALSLGMPNVGVVAHGLDRIYPKRHHKTAQQMLQCGGLLTEFPTQTKPIAQFFPMRNRIIAGMVDAVIVVETADRGGSMITAYLANEYHKEVFAVPGRIHDPVAKGCNYLIKTHRAVLLESAADIAYVLGWEKPNTSQQGNLFTSLSPQEQLLVDQLLGKDSLSIEQLLQQIPWSHTHLAAILLDLELKGLLKALPGSHYKLI